MLSTKNPLFEYIIAEFSENSKEIIENYELIMINHFPKVNKIFGDFVERLIDYFQKQEDLLVEFEKYESNEERFEEFKLRYKKQEKEFDEIMEDFSLQNNSFKKEILGERAKFESANKLPIERLKKLNNLVSEVLLKNPERMVYKYLELIKDIDSFNIKFSKSCSSES